jgi:hypothetical protein
MLSMNTEVSTASASASLMQEHVGTEGIYRSIGAGSCGIVFEQLRSTLALKIAKVDNDALWNDYRMHTRIVEGFSGIELPQDLHIPKVYISLWMTVMMNGGWNMKESSQWSIRESAAASSVQNAFFPFRR